MPDITIPANTAVDLYAAASITPGTQLRVTHLGGNDIKLSATEAGLLNDHTNISQRQTSINNDGDAGAYAFSIFEAAVNVREA